MAVRLSALRTSRTLLPRNIIILTYIGFCTLQKIPSQDYIINKIYFFVSFTQNVEEMKKVRNNYILHKMEYLSQQQIRFLRKAGTVVLRRKKCIPSSLPRNKLREINYRFKRLGSAIDSEEVHLSL
jgi:hypothetical protein